jgi:hypothetical protein
MVSQRDGPQKMIFSGAVRKKTFAQDILCAMDNRMRMKR